MRIQDLRIDEIPSLVIKVIQHLPRGLLTALAQKALPRVTKIHRAQT